MSVSDIVTSGELPETGEDGHGGVGCCVAGALDNDDMLGLQVAGIVDVKVEPKGKFDVG